MSDWRRDALCREYPAVDFFPRRGKDRAGGSINGRAHNDGRMTRQTTLGWSDCACPLQHSQQGDRFIVGEFERPHITLEGAVPDGPVPAQLGHGRDEVFVHDREYARVGVTGKYRPGHILDPFAGTGTVGEVAIAHGYTATLIDLDPRNVDLARERCGMFLRVTP